MTTHIFGIRHHGPGSARSLRQALETLQPDVILVEGPPDADGMLPLLVHPDMKPPVALLLYIPEQPKRCVYYPFAIFSPEWQAIHYGLTNQIPVRFMDLPQAHRLAETPQASAEESQPDQSTPDSAVQPEAAIDNPEPAEAIEPDNSNQRTAEEIRLDPLGWLGRAAGYSDGERWWEHLVEQRQDSADLFAAILEAMTALREEAPPDPDPAEAQREAYMRQTIRAAQKEGFQKIAVVCGAWHGPALAQLPPAKQDTALLKGLPKTKVEATWVPWTYGRLSYNSGYGAGVESPGWYDHLWTAGEPVKSLTDGESHVSTKVKTQDSSHSPFLSPQSPVLSPQSSALSPKSSVVIRWMTKVARLLRDEDLEASSAHVIEAVRLAESLAALRDRPLPGLAELNEATQAVLCFGSDLPMRLIYDQLIVGERLGEVPDETPMVPLQQDFRRIKKRLKLPDQAPKHKPLQLDLREPTHLEKSNLLHRLNLLGIAWGTSQQATGQGTFKELWQLQWQPEYEVALIEAAVWGNTILDAATAFVRNSAEQAETLPPLTQLLDKVLLADLPDAVTHLMTHLQAAAAVASDVSHLMEALPPLVNVLRYGNVRKTDTKTVAHVVDSLVVRICIGLPSACASLDDDAATAMYDRLNQTNSAISLLQNQKYLSAWQRVLTQLSDKEGDLHGLIAGRSTRILLDVGTFSAEEAARRMGLALSTASEPPQAAAWVEGFLKGSGLLLLYDEKLWQVLDSWVTQLSQDTFTAILPLLRRTFSNFSASERRQVGERVRRGQGFSAEGMVAGEFDPTHGTTVLPLIAQLLGIQP